MKAKILKTVWDRTKPIVPAPGAILEGRLIPTGLFTSDFQVTEDGPFIGWIFKNDCYCVVKDEPKKDPVVKTLQNDIRIRDVRIERLIEERDGARANEQRAVAAAERMAENVAQLEKERQELADKLLAKKVVIPKGMADAIEFLRSQKNGHTLAYHLDWVAEMSKSHSELKDLPEHMFLKGYNTYFRVLIEGYTVEEPPTAEDRILSKMVELLKEEDLYVEEYVIKRIAYNATLAMREVFAEARQAETQ